MNPDLIARLREIAGMATPGEWIGRELYDDSKHPYVFCAPGMFFFPRFLDNDVTRSLRVKDLSAENTAHICAFNPSVAIQLLDELTKAREQAKIEFDACAEMEAQRDKMREALEFYAQGAPVIGYDRGERARLALGGEHG